jgi:hypothetical protein
VSARREPDSGEWFASSLGAVVLFARYASLTARKAAIVLSNFPIEAPAASTARTVRPFSTIRPMHVTPSYANSSHFLTFLGRARLRELPPFNERNFGLLLRHAAEVIGAPLGP